MATVERLALAMVSERALENDSSGVVMRVSLFFGSLYVARWD